MIREVPGITELFLDFSVSHFILPCSSWIINWIRPKRLSFNYSYPPLLFYNRTTMPFEEKGSPEDPRDQLDGLLTIFDFSVRRNMIWSAVERSEFGCRIGVDWERDSGKQRRKQAGYYSQLMKFYCSPTVLLGRIWKRSFRTNGPWRLFSSGY